MKDVPDDGLIGDAALVAYLDRALPEAERARLEQQLSGDPALRSRLSVLAAGDRPFRDALSPLLGLAPTARLEAMLAALPDGGKAEQPARRGPPAWALAAAALVAFLAGAAVDRLAFVDRLPSSERVADAPSEWRKAVAEYMSLYTADTLASISDDPAARASELAALASSLKLDLSAERIALPDLVFKRAQLFAYDGKALGQIVYLDPAAGPVAFCVIANGAPDAAPRAEQRAGFDDVHWARGGRAFMLVGRLPAERLQALAGMLEGRWPS